MDDNTEGNNKNAKEEKTKDDRTDKTDAQNNRGRYNKDNTRLHVDG